MQDQIKDAVYRAVRMCLNKRADFIFFQMKCGSVTTDRDGVRDFSLSFTQHISQSLSLSLHLCYSLLHPLYQIFFPLSVSLSHSLLVMNMIWFLMLMSTPLHTINGSILKSAAWWPACHIVSTSSIVRKGTASITTVSHTLATTWMWFTQVVCVWKFMWKTKIKHSKTIIASQR